MSPVDQLPPGTIVEWRGVAKVDAYELDWSPRGRHSDTQKRSVAKARSERWLGPFHKPVEFIHVERFEDGRDSGALAQRSQGRCDRARRGPLDGVPQVGGLCEPLAFDECVERFITPHADVACWSASRAFSGLAAL